MGGVVVVVGGVVVVVVHVVVVCGCGAVLLLLWVIRVGDVFYISIFLSKNGQSEIAEPYSTACVEKGELKGSTKRLGNAARQVLASRVGG